MPTSVATTQPTADSYHKAHYIGMAKVLAIMDVLGYDGQNSSFFSPPPHSDSTPITQEGSHIST